MRVSVLAAGVAGALLMQAAASAAVSVVVDSKVVASDPVLVTNTYVDVYIQVSGSEPDLGAFQGRLLQPGANPTGISFGTPTRTDTGGPTLTPLIALANQVYFDTPLGILTNSGTDVSVASGAQIGTTPLVDGRGLFRVPITIQPGVTGVFALDLLDDPNVGVFLNDDTLDANEISATVVDGTLTVVPEPATAGLLAAGAVLLLRRRRASAVF